jgi:hypothetical protein
MSGLGKQNMKKGTSPFAEATGDKWNREFYIPNSTFHILYLMYPNGLTLTPLM